jgi:tetratricopeptide (TPR) repeat protein
VSSLVEWSLVQRLDGEHAGRYRLLETVREFAVAELVGSDDESETRQRHAHYFTRFAEAAAPHLRSGDQQAWLDRLDQEHDNLRAALGWTVECGDAEAAQRLCGALALFWRIRGHYDEGRRWCAQALESDVATPPAVRANALHGYGMLAHWQGDYGAAESLYEASLALWREIGDDAGLALTLNSLGILADDVGDYERALAWQTESLQWWERAGEPWGIAHALCDIGNIAKIQGREAEALPLYRRSLDIFEQLHDEHGIALVLDNMGEVAMRQRAYAQAATLFEDALRIQRTLNQPQFVSRHLHKLGMATLALGDIERAEALQEESLQLRRALGDRRGVAFSLMQLGDVARERGDTERAAARYRESLRLRWSIGHKDGVVACLEELAATVVESRPRSAARLFGASAAMRKGIAAPMPASRQAVFERGISRAQQRLGAAAFAEAWSEGETCDLDVVVAAALDRAFWLDETS